MSKFNKIGGSLHYLRALFRETLLYKVNYEPNKEKNKITFKLRILMVGLFTFFLGQYRQFLYYSTVDPRVDVKDGDTWNFLLSYQLGKAKESKNINMKFCWDTSQLRYELLWQKTEKIRNSHKLLIWPPLSEYVAKSLLWSEISLLINQVQNDISPQVKPLFNYLPLEF